MFLRALLILAFSVSVAGCRPNAPVPDKVIDDARRRAVEIIRMSDYDPIGSGFLLNERGMILTCEHILRLYIDPRRNRERRVIVRMGGMEAPASLVHADPNVDLALLRWEAPVEMRGSLRKMDDLLAAEVRWAPRRDVRVGQPALLVGSPYGLTESVLVGSIAHTNRINTDNDYREVPFIQTSGMSYPGSSGAAVFIGDGRIIGINRATWGWSPGTGIGLVVPSGVVREFLASVR